MRYVTLLFLLFYMLCVPVEAVDVLETQSQAMELDRLVREAGEDAPTQEIIDVDLDQGLTALLDTGCDQIFGIVQKAARSGILMLTVALLCSLAEEVYVGVGGDAPVKVHMLVGVMAITAIAVTDVHSLIGMGRIAIERMEAFSTILLPTMAVATAAGGAPSRAAAQQFATMLFSGVLMRLITGLFLPLVYTYIAVSVAHTSLGNKGLQRMASALKWMITSVLTVLLLAFVGYLGVTGVIAGGADALAIKTAKLAVSNMVPIVGGILSDASETILAGAGILKNAVGVFGMLTILSICLLPFLQLGIHYLAYKLTATLAATLSDGAVTKCIDGIGGAFGLVLGMTGASALLLLVSVVSAISLVAP